MTKQKKNESFSEMKMVNTSDKNISAQVHKQELAARPTQDNRNTSDLLTGTVANISG